MSSLRQLPFRLKDLILELRHPLPGLSNLEVYQLRELRRGSWLRDGPDELTAREEEILVEMQAGFEHAQEGEDQYWEAVWERRRKIVFEREGAAAVVRATPAPPQLRVKVEAEGGVEGGESGSAAAGTEGRVEGGRPSSVVRDRSRSESYHTHASISPSSQPSPSLTTAVSRRSSAMSLSAIVEPTALPSPSSSSSSNHLDQRPRLGQEQQIISRRSNSDAESDVPKLIEGLTWESVRAMNMEKRASLAKRIIHASSTWRATLPFFTPLVLQDLLPTNETFISAFSIFDASSNCIIPKPPPYALDKTKHQKALNDLHHLVRFRSPKGRYEPGEKDDFESELFKCWEREEDGRLVERLLLSAVLNEEIRNKRSTWFGVENARAKSTAGQSDASTRTNSLPVETGGGTGTSSKGKKRARSRSQSEELEDPLERTKPKQEEF